MRDIVEIVLMALAAAGVLYWIACWAIYLTARLARGVVGLIALMRPPAIKAGEPAEPGLSTTLPVPTGGGVLPLSREEEARLNVPTFIRKGVRVGPRFCLGDEAKPQPQPHPHPPEDPAGSLVEELKKELDVS